VGTLNDTVLLPVDALAFLLREGREGGREGGRGGKERFRLE
jgi:hypothetical protein